MVIIKVTPVIPKAKFLIECAFPIFVNIKGNAWPGPKLKTFIFIGKTGKATNSLTY